MIGEILLSLDHLHKEGFVHKDVRFSVQFAARPEAHYDPYGKLPVSAKKKTTASHHLLSLFAHLFLHDSNEIDLIRWGCARVREAAEQVSAEVKLENLVFKQKGGLELAGTFKSAQQPSRSLSTSSLLPRIFTPISGCPSICFLTPRT